METSHFTGCTVAETCRSQRKAPPANVVRDATGSTGEYVFTLPLVFAQTLAVPLVLRTAFADEHVKIHVV